MKFLIIAVVLAVGLVGATARFLFKKSDNPVEEIAEKIIEKKTGYKVDLSPDTKDPDGLDLFSEEIDDVLDMIVTDKEEKVEDESKS